MAESMTPRQRVLAAIELQEPDRVPIDVGGSSVTTIIGDAYERLKAHLGIEGEARYMKRKSRTAILDERVAERLHSDTRAIIYGSPNDWEDIYFEDGSFQDEFQVIWSKSKAGGHYAPVGNPLSEASTADIDSFPWPDPLNPGRTHGLREQSRHLHEETDYAIVLSLPSGIVHLCAYLRGFEEFMVDLAINPEFVEALMDRTLDWYLQFTCALMDEVGPYVDVVMFGDDIGFQNGPMVDLDRYRRFFKPRHKRVFDCIKGKSNAKLLHHTDGAVTSFIDDLIEIGVDILNPVQASAAGMETANLKAKYGDRICFWGGIDTQSVLPMGSPEDVRAEVHRRIEDLSCGGGYVISSVHNMQEDVPLENILAMADAALEFG